jgi:TRAP-type C4-dicarboxylate transport system substrate-binding protein
MAEGLNTERRGARSKKYNSNVIKTGRFAVKLSRTIATALIVAAATTTFAPAGQADEVKLKAASFLPTRVIFAKFFGDWVESVNKVCKGKVQISIVGPSAIKSLEQWNALKTGVIDMHYGPPNYYGGTAPEASVTDLAGKSLEEQRKNGAWAMLNQIHEQKLNAHYLTQIGAGLHFFIYTTKPAKDGKFDSFRLRSVPIYDGFFKSLGAQPIRMAPPAVYTGLERNVVDGIGWPLWGVNDFSWDKFLKFRYGPGFYSAGINILVNLDKWKSLSKDQTDCLNERTVWLEKVWPEWRQNQNEKELAAQKKSGIAYVDLGKGFAKKADDIYWAAMNKANPEFTSKIKPLLAE